MHSQRIYPQTTYIRSSITKKIQQQPDPVNESYPNQDTNRYPNYAINTSPVLKSIESSLQQNLPADQTPMPNEFQDATAVQPEEPFDNKLYQKYQLAEDLYQLMAYLQLKEMAEKRSKTQSQREKFRYSSLWTIIKKSVKCEPLKHYENLQLMFIFTVVTQQICLIIMLWDLLENNSYFKLSQPISYIPLRFILIVFTYYLFCKDYKSLSEYLMMRQQIDGFKRCLSFTIFFWIRLIFIMINEGVVIGVILTSNLGQDSGLGMITNFSAALIVSQIDDLMMDTAVVAEIKQYYENLPEEPLEAYYYQKDKREMNQLEQSQVVLLNKLGLNVTDKIIDLKEDKANAKPKLKPFFRHAGYMTIYVHADINLTSHGCPRNTRCKITTFTLHKLLILSAIGYNLFKQFTQPTLIAGVQFGYPISYSSAYSGFDSSYSRINSTSAWCPTSSNNDLDKFWIQVLSPQDELWVKFGIQGKKDQDYWVKTFLIQYSGDGSGWSNVTYSGSEIFQGNSDRNTIIQYSIDATLSDQYVLAKAIRIVPLTWNGYPCLRFEAHHITS